MKTTTIYGPPGTGKTSRLVSIVSGITDKRVQMLSFSKAAALETASRLPETTNVRASTIHSMLFNYFGMGRASMVDGKKLCVFGDEAGFPFKGGEDNSDEAQEGDEYALVVAYSNNRMVDIHEAYDKFGRPGTWHRFNIFTKAYRDWKHTYGYMDFDDLLMNFLRDDIRVPEYAQVMVIDEAQDCSPLQWAVIKKLVSGGNVEQIYIAGDDDQAIFEWNGADPHGMVRFGEEMNSEFVTLDKSYRVPAVAHEFVHGEVIPQFGNRYSKKFEPAPRPGTLHRWGDIWSIDFGAVAHSDNGAMVLLRDRFRLDEVKRLLNREMIPYEVLGGGSPWTNKYANAVREGKDINIPQHWAQFYRMAKRGGYLNAPINITLSTIHQAKGREHDTVIMDLTLPHRAEYNIYHNRDAELRVMYVGLTRAINHLHVCGENQLIP